MKPPFTSTQEMYNYAANQLIVQNLSQETVKNNLMERGVTDADAEIVIQNMMVQIEKDKPATATAKQKTGPAFTSTQEMYNFAANQMIVQKLSNPTVKANLVKRGVSDAEADIVIQNMMDQIEKDKPTGSTVTKTTPTQNETPKTAEVNPKRAEGKRMMLVGLVVAAIGAAISGINFNIAGEPYAITYGVLAVGAILFFRGLVKMF